VVDNTINKWLFRISLVFLAAVVIAAQSVAQSVHGSGRLKADFDCADGIKQGDHGDHGDEEGVQ